jgi:hypothetical protein
MRKFLKLPIGITLLSTVICSEQICRNSHVRNKPFCRLITNGKELLVRHHYLLNYNTNREG